MGFVRLRRLRKTAPIRELLCETRLSVKDLIAPYFVIDGRNKKEEIRSLPGICRLSIDNLIKDIEEVKDSGIKTVLLFGLCNKKDELGTHAYRKDGLVQRAIKTLRKEIKDIAVVTDVCLCGYTLHGHCGIVKKTKIKNQKFYVDNDATLKILAKIALSHAEAGADFVAPSAMMDGQVETIREVLDKNDFKGAGILAYSAKYASGFYGPFREALDSSPQFGDRKTYQMDYRNSDQALREIEQDIAEGADIVMVKPALAYLDIIYRVKQKFNIPVAAYNVSGEYALAKAADSKGIACGKEVVREILTAIKRAGADLIITYHAKEVAKWLKH